MTDVLQGYLATVDADAAPVVTALDRVIREAAPELTSAVRYRILMYAMPGDWTHWVCAVDASRRAVGLRFLFGHLLSDPQHVLRAGTSTLMTWDLPRDAAVDEDGVRAYVREAVTRYDDFHAESAVRRATPAADPAPPADLVAALTSAGVRQAFDALAPSHRREHVRSVEEAVRPDTRARRIAKVVDALR